MKLVDRKTVDHRHSQINWTVNSHFCSQLGGYYCPWLHGANLIPWYRPLYAKHLTLTLTFDIKDDQTD